MVIKPGSFPLGSSKKNDMVVPILYNLIVDGTMKKSSGTSPWMLLHLQFSGIGFNDHTQTNQATGRAKNGRNRPAPEITYGGYFYGEIPSDRFACE